MAEILDLFPGLKVDDEGGETDKVRAVRCLNRITEILKEENCGILPDIRFVGMNMSAGITIIAKPYEVPATSQN